MTQTKIGGDGNGQDEYIPVSTREDFHPTSSEYLLLPLLNKYTIACMVFTNALNGLVAADMWDGMYELIDTLFELPQIGVLFAKRPEGLEVYADFIATLDF